MLQSNVYSVEYSKINVNNMHLQIGTYWHMQLKLIKGYKMQMIGDQ